MARNAKPADALLERRRYLREEVLELTVVQLTLLQRTLLLKLLRSNPAED